MKASTRGYIEALTEKHRMEKQLDEVRLQMLKNQINPHFLFNTLNMIYKKAYSEGAYETSELMEKTSQLLRYGLDNASKISSLEKGNQGNLQLQLHTGKTIR